MKTLLAIAYFLYGVTVANAQSIERSVIGATGSYISTPTLKVSATVGEPVIGAAATASLIVTEGFQQPDGTRSNAVNTPSATADIKVYPNPASESVNIEVNGTSLTMGIGIYNEAGQLVRQYDDWTLNNGAKKTLDFSAFAIGGYLVEVKSVNGQIKKVFKVQKIR